MNVLKSLKETNIGKKYPACKELKPNTNKHFFSSDNEGNLILNTTDGAMRELDVPYEAILGGVQLSIASTQDGFLNILVSDHSNVSKDGILGKIFNQLPDIVSIIINAAVLINSLTLYG